MRTADWETAPQIAPQIEELLHRGRAEVIMDVILLKGSTCNQAHIFCRSFFLVTKSSHHHEGF